MGPREAYFSLARDGGALISFLTVSHRIAVIPGDGIGKEVVSAALEVVKATGAALEFVEFDWSADRYLADGVTVPPDGFKKLGRDFDAIFVDRKSTRLNSSHIQKSRMPSSA